jgi:hypothetical protein
MIRVATFNVGRAGQTQAEQAIEAKIAQSNAATETPGQRLTPRLYVQYQNLADLNRIENFRNKARLISLNGAELDVPQAEPIAPEKMPARTELRCFFAGDCEEAKLLLPQLEQLLGEQIRLSEQVGRYPESRMRPRHFELWFGRLGGRPAVSGK